MKCRNDDGTHCYNSYKLISEKYVGYDEVEYIYWCPNCGALWTFSVVDNRKFKDKETFPQGE